MGFFEADGFPRKEVLPGIRVGSVFLGNLMLTHFTMETGSDVPPHSHPHEQISFVVSGVLDFTLAGETRRVGSGAGCAIPSGVVHSVNVVEEAVVIDCWHPIREDYIVGERPIPAVPGKGNS
jgi:quercetin dioxygenase-like cupin family protein